MTASQLELLAATVDQQIVSDVPRHDLPTPEPDLPFDSGDFPLPVASVEDVFAAADRAKKIHALRWEEARFAGGTDTTRVRTWRAELTWTARRLIRSSGGLTNLREVTDGAARNAMRFLPDVPVSDDDLDVQVECLTVPDGPLHGLPPERARGAVIERLLGTSTDRLMSRRGSFTRAEENEVVGRIVGQMLARRVETHARGLLSQSQERKVREVMESVGLRPRAATTQISSRDGIAVGEFSPREVKIATPAGRSKADAVARPSRDVIVAIECKVSSSSLNGHKRLVKETVGKAAEWRRALGADAVRSVAVIGGVFKPDDVLTAQANGVFVVWDHDLEPLGMFLLELLDESGVADLDHLTASTLF